MIGARALQGLGAALLPPTALSILAVTFEDGPERNRALGVYGAVTGISASVGVIASGLLTSGPGWRWVFFINVPVGVILIGLAVVFLPADSSGSRRGEHFDAAGAVTVTGGLLLLVYALNRGAGHGWGSWPTIGLFAGSAVLLSAFAAIEARSRSPLVPGSAVRNRTLVAANLSSFFVFGGLLSFIFLGSLLMQQVLGYSPTRTGVAWLATTAMSFVAAAVTGAKLAAVVGVRRLLVAGLALLAVSALLLTRIPVGGHYATGLLPAFLLAGLGGGMSAPAVQIAALSGVVPALTGVASGLLETMREVAGAITIAIVSTVLISRSRQRGRCGRRDRHGRLAERFPRRILGDLRRGRPRRDHGRDRLPAARRPGTRARASPGPQPGHPGAGGGARLRRYRDGSPRTRSLSAGSRVSRR